MRPLPTHKGKTTRNHSHQKNGYIRSRGLAGYRAALGVVVRRGSRRALLFRNRHGSLQTADMALELLREDQVLLLDRLQRFRF